MPKTGLDINASAYIIESVVNKMVDWGQAVLIFILGIGTVFAVLILLWAILALMKVVFYRPESKAVAPAVAPKMSAPAARSERKMSTPKVVASAPPANEDELVAVFTAAVAADSNSTNLRVKSYKKM